MGVKAAVVGAGVLLEITRAAAGVTASTVACGGLDSNAGVSVALAGEDLTPAVAALSVGAGSVL